MDVEKIISDIIQAAYDVRSLLMPGFLEKVYENAMLIELRDKGYHVKQQVPIDVRYKGYQVGEYIADLIVEDSVIIEIKAAKNIDVSHEIQTVCYLTATGIDNGIVVNFGNPQGIQIKRKYRTYDSTKSTNKI
jgi:GxxExxY protein